jgi:hypothetical protein
MEAVRWCRWWSPTPRTQSLVAGSDPRRRELSETLVLGASGCLLHSDACLLA